jgi:hypothetical protein
MQTTGPLEPGIARVVERGTGALIGYVFTVENGAGQLQRWLLHRPPQNNFEVRPPPPDMAGWTLADWRARVPELWRPGSHYVRAQANVYVHGGTYDGVTWGQIPAEAMLPEPSYPQVPGDYQLDPTPTHVCVAIQHEHELPGMIYCIGGLASSASAEYWMLPAGFQPAGANASVAVTGGTERAASLQGFIDVANRAWAPGCVLAITGCVNYTGAEPPAMP